MNWDEAKAHATANCLTLADMAVALEWLMNNGPFPYEQVIDEFAVEAEPPEVVVDIIWSGNRPLVLEEYHE